MLEVANSDALSHADWVAPLNLYPTRAQVNPFL